MIARNQRLAQSILVVASAWIAVGCFALTGYDQRGGVAIADEIRSSGAPIVGEVDHVAGDHVDAAKIDITVRVGTTTSEISEFVCEVVIPAIRKGDPPDDLGVFIWDDKSTHILASDEMDCSSPSSPAA